MSGEPTAAHLLLQLAATRQADESARSRLPMGGEGK